MMSSNSSSTDPADDFPEVDDYSVVDDLDLVAAEVAAELANAASGAPEPPVEPSTVDTPDGPATTAGPADGSEGHATVSTPEELTAALAEQVGLDLQDGPIAAGPVDLAHHGLVDEDQVDGQSVAARAGWFPPDAAHGHDAGPGQHAPGPDGSSPAVGAGEPVGPTTGSTEPTPPVEPVGPAGAGHLSPGPGPADRPPSSPAVEQAPLVPPPAEEPPAPAVASDGQGADQQTHPVDQIAVRKLGGFNFLSVGQWSALPRDERARLVKGGLAMFLFEGEEVDVRPALLWLKQLARSEADDPNDPTVRRRGR